MSLVLEYMTNAIKKRCTAFLISDFIALDNYKNALSIANRKHDLVGIQIYDKRETELPNVGLVKMYDAENGSEDWIDSSSKKVRDAYIRWWNERQNVMLDYMRKSRVDLASIATDEDYVKALIGLFKRRS